jgi:hypothetical protein
LVVLLTKNEGVVSEKACVNLYASPFLFTSQTTSSLLFSGILSRFIRTSI